MDFDSLDGVRISQVLPSLFAGVAPEQKIFEDYLAATNHTVESVFNELFHDRRVAARRPKFLGPALGDEKAVLDLADLVCSSCALAVLETALETEWPKMMKEPEFKDFLPGALERNFRTMSAADQVFAAQVITRTDCWYGLGCRTAVHNLHHAQRLNHLCPATRATPPAAVPGARTLYHPQAGLVPPIDLTAVTFRDLNGSPVALASSQLPTGRTPGKCILSKLGQLGRYQAFFSAAVGEQEQGGNGNGGIEVLWEVEGEVKWVRTSRGEVPDGERPVEGGRDGAEELWHAAGWVKGVRVPGKTSRGMGEARLSFGGKAWGASIVLSCRRHHADSASQSSRTITTCWSGSESLQYTLLDGRFWFCCCTSLPAFL